MTQPHIFPSDGRRLLVYVIWDRRGGVEDFVLFTLAGLRTYSERILVVVNGSLDEGGRAALEEVCDEILVRPNVGFDIWAHKHAIDHLGEAINEYDEVVFANDTWYGPVRPFGPVFERMDAEPIDFWGMTDHAREEPNPFTGKGVMHYHLQSFWIAVRRRMLESSQWRDYWRNLPSMPGYFDAVLKHEVVFTHAFESEGFTHGVAFPSEDYPTDHPALFNADLLLDAGCPLIKRRPFFHYPPFLDRHAVIGRDLLNRVAQYGYPVDNILSNLARNVAPRTLNADLAMLEVLPDAPVKLEASPRLLVALHVSDAAAAGALLDRLSAITEAFELVVTVASSTDAESVREALRNRDDPRMTSAEVRALPPNDGRDIAALFVGLADVLAREDLDLIARVHTMKMGTSTQNARRYFQSQQVDNIIDSPGYFSNLLALFESEPGLGVVFPPTVHIGYAPLGRGWSIYGPAAERLCKQLHVRVPLDGVSPLAPLGGMMVFRPRAMRALTERKWAYDDYRRAAAPGGADLARAQERIIANVAGESGFHCRTVITERHAALSHLSLEYTFDQLASTTPGYPVEQIQFFHRAGWMSAAGPGSFARMYLRFRYPGLARRLDPALDLLRRALVKVKALRRPLRRRPSRAEGGNL